MVTNKTWRRKIMLDINLIRQEPQKVAEALAKKEYEVDFTE